MALFGLNGSVLQSADQALTAARAMRARLDDLNVAFAGNLDAPLRMGIGIHIGPAIVGEIGYGRTRSLTAVGDTVNIASRLQGLSKDHGCDLLVSEALLRAAGFDPMNAAQLETEIRGRAAPMAIYTFRTIDSLPKSPIDQSSSICRKASATMTRPTDE
jgi:adenylate cyclase